MTAGVGWASIEGATDEEEASDPALGTAAETEKACWVCPPGRAAEPDFEAFGAADFGGTVCACSGKEALGMITFLIDTGPSETETAVLGWVCPPAGGAVEPDFGAFGGADFWGFGDP